MPRENAVICYINCLDEQGWQKHTKQMLWFDFYRHLVDILDSCQHVLLTFLFVFFLQLFLLICAGVWCVVFCWGACNSFDKHSAFFFSLGRDGTLGQCEVPKDPRYPDCPSKMDVSLHISLWVQTIPHRANISWSLSISRWLTLVWHQFCILR